MKSNDLALAQEEEGQEAGLGKSAICWEETTMCPVSNLHESMKLLWICILVYSSPLGLIFLEQLVKAG